MLQHIARVLRLTQFLALLLVVGMGILLYGVVAEFEGAGRWVDHTHEVMDEIEVVRVESMRSGLWLRNFQIVPDMQSLQRSRASAARATQSARHLLALTADNSAQHETMQQLQSELSEVLGMYRSWARVAERDGAAMLQPLVAASVTSDATARLRELLNRAERVERSLLEHRSEVQARRFAILKRLLAVGGIAFALVMLWTIRYSGRLLRLGHEQLHRLQAHAQQDPLTGLLNRRGLREQAALTDGDRGGERVAVLAFDLDDFKPVNDRHGHAAGDHVLQEVARRLQQQCRAGDAIARVGGDEFIVMLRAVRSRAEAAGIAQRLRAHLMAPIELAGAQVRIGASIGVALLHEDGDDVEALLRRADAQMYAAKRAGKGCGPVAAGVRWQLAGV